MISTTENLELSSFFTNIDCHLDSLALNVGKIAANLDQKLPDNIREKLKHKLIEIINCIHPARNVLDTNIREKMQSALEEMKILLEKSFNKTA